MELFRCGCPWRCRSLLALTGTQARSPGRETEAAVLLKAYQPPEELTACREGDMFVVHNLADKCASVSSALSSLTIRCTSSATSCSRSALGYGWIAEARQAEQGSFDNSVRAPLSGSCGAVCARQLTGQPRIVFCPSVLECRMQREVHRLWLQGQMAPERAQHAVAAPEGDARGHAAPRARRPPAAAAAHC